ncbi:MAG: hypothetical protein OEM49_04705 [Myxococcales bacterium]|nr:hypothetical protein [Myxococcales bacterium]MDH5307948.1 hypothetical protein [Myxococcales bacterium]MDH5565577.1 hypothetical protein [Myxococcales bacterium]
MQESAYILEIAAGICFLAAGIGLLRSASANGKAPERLLGVTFLLMGISYVFYEIPFVLASDRHFVLLSTMGRLSLDASVVSMALFTRRVFYNTQEWSTRVIRSVVALLILGVVVSGFYGDWEGLAPLENPGFWLEWIGQMVPFAWVASAGLSHYMKARRRLRVGLSDAMVCNRFLLFTCFGVAQACSLFLIVRLYIDFEAGIGFSGAMDALLGSLEIVSVLLIWLAFFPPSFYRSWIGHTARPGSAGKG